MVHGQNLTSAMVTADPTSGAPAGTKMNFQPHLFVLGVEAGSHSVRDWDHFDGVLLAIHFGLDTSQKTLGSGVLVAPGVALAAKHVVEPMIPALMDGKIACTCTAFAKHGLLIWRVREITLRNNCDVCILSLSLATEFPPGNSFKLAAITTRTPKLGEHVFITGFRSHGILADAGEVSRVNVAGEVRLSVGEVSGLFEEGRDRVLLPFPSFQVECDTLGGMSGGPVFDHTGHVIGLLSTGGIERVSNVALLWPVLTLQFPASWPQGLHKERLSLIEMDRRLCVIEKPKAVQIDIDASNAGRRTIYSSWD